MLLNTEPLSSLPMIFVVVLVWFFLCLSLSLSSLTGLELTLWTRLTSKSHKFTSLYFLSTGFTDVHR